MKRDTIHSALARLYPDAHRERIHQSLTRVSTEDVTKAAFERVHLEAQTRAFRHYRMTKPERYRKDGTTIPPEWVDVRTGKPVSQAQFAARLEATRRNEAVRLAALAKGWSWKRASRHFTRQKRAGKSWRETLARMSPELKALASKVRRSERRRTRSAQE